eukprot:6398456-Pyramimonas_sp.AAC.1
MARLPCRSEIPWRSTSDASKAELATDLPTSARLWFRALSSSVRGQVANAFLSSWRTLSAESPAVIFAFAR